MNGEKKIWMVWWLEQIEQSGYNKYVVIKMTHELTWRGPDGSSQTQWGYFSGPGTSTIADTIKSSTGDALYKENNNLYMFITPYNAALARDVYIEVPYNESKEAYVVSHVDINSTPGVSYVSTDPSYVRDASAPNMIEDVNDAKTYWLNGGNK